MSVLHFGKAKNQNQFRHMILCYGSDILSLKNLLTLKWQQSIFLLEKMASIIETSPLQQE